MREEIDKFLAYLVFEANPKAIWGSLVAIAASYLAALLYCGKN